MSALRIAIECLSKSFIKGFLARMNPINAKKHQTQLPSRKSQKSRVLTPHQTLYTPLWALFHSQNHYCTALVQIRHSPSGDPKARAWFPASPARQTPAFLCIFENWLRPRHNWRRWVFLASKKLCKIVQLCAFEFLLRKGKGGLHFCHCITVKIIVSHRWAGQRLINRKRRLLRMDLCWRTLTDG